MRRAAALRAESARNLENEEQEHQGRAPDRGGHRAFFYRLRHPAPLFRGEQELFSPGPEEQHRDLRPVDHHHPFRPDLPVHPGAQHPEDVRGTEPGRRRARLQEPAGVFFHRLLHRPHPAAFLLRHRRHLAEHRAVVQDPHREHHDERRGGQDQLLRQHHPGPRALLGPDRRHDPAEAHVHRGKQDLPVQPAQGKNAGVQARRGQHLQEPQRDLHHAAPAHSQPGIQEPAAERRLPRAGRRRLHHHRRPQGRRADPQRRGLRHRAAATRC